MDEPIKKIERQVRRYWYVDGLTEMGAGILILTLGLLYLLIALLSPGDFADWLMGLGQPLLLGLGYLVVNWAVKHFKEKITYPRTGYVSYRQERGKQRLGMILLTFGLGALFAAALAVAGKMTGERWLPLWIGLLLGGAVAYLGYSYDLVRFYLLGIFTAVLGGLGAVLGLADKFAMALFFGGFGLGWIVSGTYALRSYLRYTLPASPEEEA
jgi:hypothetical protein